jgi:hypothetical protein
MAAYASCPFQSEWPSERSLISYVEMVALSRLISALCSCQACSEIHVSLLFFYLFFMCAKFGQKKYLEKVLLALGRLLLLRHGSRCLGRNKSRAGRRLVTEEWNRVTNA